MSLLLTVQLMFVAVAIATVVGIVGAWAASTAHQSQGPVGRLCSRLFFVAMVICVATPLILHAAAWEATAGKFGWLPLTQVGSRGYGGLGGVFNGLVACGWIHGLFGSSLVALATWYGTLQVPAAVIQQSQLEMGLWRSWWKVRLPLALPWTTTALLATAALTATEMTVADLYGYRTLADRFYLQYIVDPTRAAVLRTIAVPLAMAGLIMLVVFSRWNTGRSINAQHSSNANQGPRDANRGPRDASRSTSAANQRTSTSTEHHSNRTVAVAATLSVGIAGLVVLVPLLGIVIKAGHQIIVVGTQRSVGWSATRFVENVLNAPVTFAAEYQWTIVLAGLTGVVAAAIGWTIASVGRTHPRFRTVCDGLSILLVLIPGPLVGIAIVRFFQIDIPGFRSLYHQTLVPTLIGLLVRAVPVTYWIVRAGYQGIDDRVLQSAAMEMTWGQRMWSIDRPLLAKTVVTSFVAAMIVSSGDVPAMLPIMPPGVTTVGTRLFEQLHSGARYQEASLAIWYVMSVVGLVMVSLRWTNKSHGKLG